MKKFVVCSLWSVVCIASLCTSAQARHIVASNNFDTTNQDHGWYSSNGWATVDHVTSGGGVDNSGWLSTTWTNVSLFDPLAPYSSDLFVTDATNLFAGNWSTNMWFELDFWAGTNTPASVQVEWGSTNDDRIWRDNIYLDGTNSMSTGEWTHLTSDVFMNWEMGFWELSDFVDDLAAIDWIGIRIERSSGDADLYGIDNFNLMVPEPAEIILLLFAGVSSLMTLRKKKREETI